MPLVIAALRDENASPLQIERSATARAEIVELEDEGVFLLGESSSGVELYLEKGPSHVYKGGEQPALNL